MRHLCIAALVFAGMAIGVAAEPQRLTGVEMDRITAGSGQTTSYSVSETSRMVNGKTRTRTEIIERVWDGKKFQTRKVVAVNGKVTQGDRELYRRYTRDKAQAGKALKSVLSGVDLKGLNDLGRSLNLENVLGNFNFEH